MRNRKQKRSHDFWLAVGFLYGLTFAIVFLLMFARLGAGGRRADHSAVGRLPLWERCLACRSQPLKLTEVRYTEREERQ